MNSQLFYKDGQGHVVDEHGCPEPVDYVVDEELYTLQSLKKKAKLHPLDRNIEAKIQEWFDWVRRWDKTDMDYRKNCVFLDESAFHINVKRSMVWSK